jgi:anti-sigma factor RsiW
MCDDKTIKELLPEYQAQQLQNAEKDRIEKHLESCEDCRTEVALLHMMEEETIPDPGEAYWAAMPDRVYRAVEAHKARNRGFDLSWLLDWFMMPRWVVAAATAVMVLALSWYVIHPLPNQPGAPAPKGYDLSDEIAGSEEPHLSSLDTDQLATVADWAGKELSSIGSEAALVVANGTDATDIDEELAELNARDAKKLSTLLDHYVEEV